MVRFQFAHIVFGVIASLVFGSMVVISLGYTGSASWFPLYTGTIGFILSVITTIAATVSVLRQRRSAAHLQSVAATPVVESGTLPVMGFDDASEEGMTNQQVVLRGLAWLCTWLGFIFMIMVIGFIASSVLWLGIWFRTVVKWPFKVLIPVLAGVFVVLWLAETQLHMAMPGGWGWLGDAMGL